MRSAALAKLKDTHTYKVPVVTSLDNEQLKAPSDPDVIHLDPYFVSGDREQLDLARDFDHKAEVRAAQMFTLEKGGLIITKQLGRVEAQIGVWVSLVPSRAPGAVPILRVDFLNLRW